jgi:HD-like signal output (HDOD) protein
MSTPQILIAIALVAAIAALVVWLTGRGRSAAPRPDRATHDAPHWTQSDVQPSAADAAPPAVTDVPGPRQILRRLYALAFDDATLEAGEASPRARHAEIIAATVEMLRTIDAQPRYAPRRPTLLPQLLQAINDGEAPLRQLARIIGQDPALTGNLLRVANAPLYRVSRKPVESIERAVALIGTDGMRAIVAAALVQPVLSGGGAFGRVPEIIWEHTLYAASAAESYAALVEDTDPFAAQMLALLYGLGTIIVFRVARDQYAAHSGVAPDANVIAAILDRWSGSTARRISASWGMSERINDALHDQLLEAAPDTLTPLGRSLRFGRLAGALSILAAEGRSDDNEALAALRGDDRQAAAVKRIWERLRRANG